MIADRHIATPPHQQNVTSHSRTITLPSSTTPLFAPSLNRPIPHLHFPSFYKFSLSTSSSYTSPRLHPPSPTFSPTFPHVFTHLPPPPHSPTAIFHRSTRALLQMRPIEQTTAPKPSSPSSPTTRRKYPSNKTKYAYTYIQTTQRTSHKHQTIRDKQHNILHLVCIYKYPSMETFISKNEYTSGCTSRPFPQKIKPNKPNQRENKPKE